MGGILSVSILQLKGASSSGTPSGLPRPAPQARSLRPPHRPALSARPPAPPPRFLPFTFASARARGPRRRPSMDDLDCDSTWEEDEEEDGEALSAGDDEDGANGAPGDADAEEEEEEAPPPGALQVQPRRPAHPGGESGPAPGNTVSLPPPTPGRGGGMSWRPGLGPSSPPLQLSFSQPPSPSLMNPHTP